MMRVLVTGARGQLGCDVVAELERRAAERTRSRGFEVIASDVPELDITDRDAVMTAFSTYEPSLVLHLAAFTAVDACETERDRAWSVNALGTRHVVEAARLVGAHMTYISTDYVFDGTLDRPYTEWDEPNPLSMYGRSKLAGEREIGADGLIVRTSWLVGRHGANMVKTVLALMAGDGPMHFVADQHGSPTVAHDLARTLVSLSLERRSGLFHVTNQGTTSWFGFACAVVEAAGGDATRVEPISTVELVPARPAPRPQNSVLDNTALRLSGMALLPDWRRSVGALVQELIA
jgi:dTDP-4-dehydrorhamnose reductase